MAEDSKRLLLLSSNLRRRYAEDILTALALPSGAMIQFRYGDEYVALQVDRDVEKRTIEGIEALLAFVADVDSPTPFVVPVRYATVVSAERVANIFIFRLRLGAYVDLEQFPQELDGIHKLGKEFIDGLKASNRRYCPAVYIAPELRVKKAPNEPDAWQQTASRLALHDTFSGSYFMRVDIPHTQKGRPLKFNSDGRLEVVDQQSVRVATSFYSEKYDPSAKPVLACTTDGTFLRVSSDSEYEIALRYDTVEFWVHPASLNFETLSRLTVSLSSAVTDALVPAYARFPVTVRRSRSRLVIRVLATSVGALLVALPAILGPNAPVTLRVVSAVVGAALLAVASVILSATK